MAAAQRHLLLMVPFFEMGGANKFDLDLMEQLAAHGWRTTCVAALPSGHAWLEAYRAHAARIQRLDLLEEPEAKSGFFKRLAEDDPPDAVMIAQAELGYLLLPYLREIFPAAAVADYVHIEESWGCGGFAGFAAGMNPLLDATLASSGSLREAIARRGADPTKIEVCTVNVDTRFWVPSEEARMAARKGRGIREDEAVIAFTGRLAAQKQPAVLLNALKILAAEGIAFRGLVAGEGPERRWMENEIEASGLAGLVHLLPTLPPEGVRELLAAADIFFLPSANEGIALSIYEAMSMCLPIVGADVGGQRELVSPECGTLLPPRTATPQAYAAELAGLIKDPELRRSRGAAGRRRVQGDFDIAMLGERVSGILENAIQTRRHRSYSAGQGADKAAVATAAIRFAGQTGAHDSRDWLAFALTVAELEPHGSDYRRFVLSHARSLLERTPTFTLFDKLSSTSREDDETVLRAFSASLIARMTGRRT